MGRGGERASVVVGTAKSRNREEEKTSLWGKYRFRLAFLTLPENKMIREERMKTVFKQTHGFANHQWWRVVGGRVLRGLLKHEATRQTRQHTSKVY